MKSLTPVSVILFALILLLFSAPLPAQTTIYVDDDAFNDPGPGDTAISDPLEDGTVSHPYDAIQEGINAAANGDTVLVADGLYVGAGNHSMSFLGKAITVKSENGPENCTVDCEHHPSENRWGFEFSSGEGPDSILEGMTITRAIYNQYEPDMKGNGVFIKYSSPTIIGNVITDTRGWGMQCGGSDALIVGNFIADGTSSGIALTSGTPLIRGNTIVRNGNSSSTTGGGIFVGVASTARIVGNFIADNQSERGGGIYASQGFDFICSPLIDNNIIAGNSAVADGGGVYIQAATPPSFTNNLIIGNDAYLGGGMKYIKRVNTGSGVLEPVLVNCTLAHNTARYGGGLWVEAISGQTLSLTLVNTILADNTASGHPNAANLVLDGPASTVTVTVTIDHCLIKDGLQSVYIGNQTLIQASPVLTGDPLFVGGPDGDYCLSQIDAGQAADSPALDAGSANAASICIDGGDETICLDMLSTRTDRVSDIDIVDLGYHYPAVSGTVSAFLGCVPSTGTLPFPCQFSASLINNYGEQARRLQFQVDAALAGGQFFSNWRRGWQNVPAGQTDVRSWIQSIPDLGTLVGENVFTLLVEDVTPAPYNQPPYPPAGDTDTAACTVTGVAP